MRNKTVSLIVKVSIFSALAIILYVVPGLQFPLPFIFPGFLKVQFSTLPAILCGFISGPIGGLLVVLIKFIAKILITGSDTFVIGELADLLIGSIVVLTTSLIYKYYHTKKGGKIALIFGTLAWVFAGVLSNWLILMPAYIAVYGKETIIGMCSIIPNLNEDNFMTLYLFVAVAPFNALIAVVSNFITFLVYKKTSYLFHSFDKKQTNNS